MTTETPLRVCISGAGIASAVFSSWLLKGLPTAQITIIERDPQPRLTGASVDIRSSAVDIIKWMGVEPEIRAHTTNEAGVQFVNSDGSPVATLWATGRSDIQSVTSEYEIFRGKLAEIFFKTIPEGRLRMVYGETIEYYSDLEDGSGIEVTFKNGKTGHKTEKFDLLIGADGLRSKIRGGMLGTHPSEQIHDEGVHVAYFTIDRDLLDGSRLAKWYNAPLGRCIFLRPDPDPAGKTRGNLMNVTTKGDIEMKKRLNDALFDNEKYMALLEESFGDAGWLAQEVLRGMRRSGDFYCSLFAQIRSPKLVKGRVALIGDAGYATPGAGTSLAIIGGYALAGELLSSFSSPPSPLLSRSQTGSSVTQTPPTCDPIPAALARYEALMLPFVKAQQGDIDNAMQYMNPQTWWGIKIRNAIARFVTGLYLDRLAMMAAAWWGYTEKKLEMPSYEWPGAEGIYARSKDERK